MNNFFASVCTTDNGITPQFDNTAVNSDSGKLDSITFDAPKLHKAIRKIKTKSKLSCGPDGYPIILLLSLANDLTEPLSLIFNSVMSVGKIPSAWKTAIVTPFFKKGASSDLANYRPISQTSIFCKLMERIIVA